MTYVVTARIMGEPETTVYGTFDTEQEARTWLDSIDEGDWDDMRVERLIPKEEYV